MQIRGKTEILAHQKQEKILAALQHQLDIHPRLLDCETTITALKNTHNTLLEEREILEKSTFKTQMKLDANSAQLTQYKEKFERKKGERKRLRELIPHAEKITTDFLQFQHSILSANKQFSDRFWRDLQQKVADLLNATIDLNAAKIALFEIFSDHLLIENINDPFYCTQEEYDSWSLTDHHKKTKEDDTYLRITLDEHTSDPENDLDNPFDDFSFNAFDTQTNNVEVSDEKEVGPVTTTNQSTASPIAAPIQKSLSSQPQYNVKDTEKIFKTIDNKLKTMEEKLIQLNSQTEKENKDIIDDNLEIVQDMEINARPGHDITQNQALRDALQINHNSLEQNKKYIEEIKNDLAAIKDFKDNMIEVVFRFKRAKQQNNAPVNEIQPILDEMNYAMSLLEPKDGFKQFQNECTVLHLLFAYIQTDIFFQPFRKQLDVLFNQPQRLSLKRNDITSLFEQKLKSLKEKLATALAGRKSLDHLYFSSYFFAIKQLFARLNHLESYLKPRDFINTNNIKLFAITNLEQEESDITSYPGKIYHWASQVDILIAENFKLEMDEKLQLGQFIQDAIEEANAPKSQTNVSLSHKLFSSRHSSLDTPSTPVSKQNRL